MRIVAVLGVALSGLFVIGAVTAYGQINTRSQYSGTTATVVDDRGNLRVPSDYRTAYQMLGSTHAKRVDSSIKVDGRALYGIDTRLPGMSVAAVAISPVLGGKAKTVDEKAALTVKGVRQVVNIDEAVAVVADHMGAAKKGLEAAAITWDDGPNGKVSNADIVKQLEEESKKPGVVARKEGDAGKAFAEAAQRLGPKRKLS